jgi:hypothetical protein
MDVQTRKAVVAYAAMRGQTVAELLEEELSDIVKRVESFQTASAPFTPLPVSTFRDVVEATDGTH